MIRRQRTKTETEASQQPPPPSLASAALSLVLLQLISRLSTFFLNQLLLRHVEPDIYGFAAVHLEMTYALIVGLCREAVRSTLIRFKPSPDKKDPNIRNDQDRFVNFCWFPWLLGVPVFSLVYVWLKPSDAVQVRPFWMVMVGAFVELLSEPIFLYFHAQHRVKERVRVEGSAVFAKSLWTVGSVLMVNYFFEGDKTVQAICFGMSHVVYASTVTLTYCSIFGKAHGNFLGIETFKDLLPRKTFQANDTVLRLFDKTLLALSLTFIGQTIIKLILQEGDKLILTSISSDRDQGTYAVVSNYGSLIIRILFLPIEESTRAFFSRSKSLDAIGKVFQVTIKTHVLLLCIISTFQMYARYVILLLAGPKWQSAADLFSTYLLCVPILGVNGIMESYVQAVASAKQLRPMTMVMGVSFCSYVSFVVFSHDKIGRNVAIILGNGLSMCIRALWASSFAASTCLRNTRFFERVKYIRFVIPKLQTLLWFFVLYVLNCYMEPQRGEDMQTLTLQFIFQKCIRAGLTGAIAISGVLFFERNWFRQLSQLGHLKEE